MMRFRSSQHSKQSNPEFDNVTHCVRSGYHRVTIISSKQKRTLKSVVHLLKSVCVFQSTRFLIISATQREKILGAVVVKVIAVQLIYDTCLLFHWPSGKGGFAVGRPFHLYKHASHLPFSFIIEKNISNSFHRFSSKFYSNLYLSFNLLFKVLCLIFV